MACDLVYLWPRPSEVEIRALFANLYTSGEGSVPELKSYYDYCYDDAPSNPLVQAYERWLTAIERCRAPGRLLDIGCGTGLFLAVARRRGWQPFGIDESNEATHYAKTRFGLDVHTGEFSKFAAAGDRFDVISGWDIIEHARAPTSLLTAIRSSLAPQGIVALSTPSQRNIIDLVARAIYRLSAGRVRWPLEKFYIEQHFIYFTPRTLTATLARAGLRVVELERELTDLRRLTLSPMMRLTLESMFLVARLTAFENRMFVLAAAARP
jgi:SAM-dependent methyltransferase